MKVVNLKHYRDQSPNRSIEAMSSRLRRLASPYVKRGVS